MARFGILVAVAVLPFSALLPSCVMPPPGGNQNSANTNANSAANVNANGGSTGNTNTNSGANAALTIQFDAPATVSAVSVAVFVNKGNVDRSEAGDPIPLDFRANFEPNSSSTVTRSFPRGTVICLVCDESDAISSPFNTGVSPVPVPQAGQFVDWIGDTQSLGGGDAGILFFTLNENRTITARFTAMHAVILRSVGGANGTGTSLDIDYLAQAPLTVPPQHIGNTRGGNVVGTGLTGQQGLIGKFHYFRDGTIVKFTVPAPAPFTSWSGDGAISGREITFTFGQRTQTADLAWP